MNERTEVRMKDLWTQLVDDLYAQTGAMNRREMRYLVKVYYQAQDRRKRHASFQRSSKKDDEPVAFVKTMVDIDLALEDLIDRRLKDAVKGIPICDWVQSHVGFGHILAAGLFAHIDPLKRDDNGREIKTAGKVWRFAGLDPTCEWETGKKRPYNGRLKSVAIQAGRCIVFNHNHEGSFYGPLYRQRKLYEEERNKRGKLADQAREALKRVGRGTKAYFYYKRGLLPPGHVDARARRWTVKLFLGHYLEAARIAEGLEALSPYAISKLENHTRIIPAPNLEIVYDASAKRSAATTRAKPRASG